MFDPNSPESGASTQPVTREGPRESMLPMLTRAVMGQRMVLLPHHRLGASGAGVRTPPICRFSASDAGHRARRLHAAHLSDPRAAAALLVGNLRAGSADGAAAGRVWRRNGPVTAYRSIKRIIPTVAAHTGTATPLLSTFEHGESFSAKSLMQRSCLLSRNASTAGTTIGRQSVMPCRVTAPFQSGRFVRGCLCARTTYLSF